jgi:hypothetical protein
MPPDRPRVNAAEACAPIISRASLDNSTTTAVVFGGAIAAGPASKEDIAIEVAHGSVRRFAGGHRGNRQGRFALHQFIGMIHLH